MSQEEKQHQMMMMEYDPATAPAQPPHMMSPPGYSEAVSGPSPLTVSTAPAFQTSPGGSPGVELGSEPVQLSCWSCHRQIVTDVRSEISSSGWAFCCCCCIFGSWLASLLVSCLPGFRKFTHLCPLCRALIGEAEPSHSGKHIALIVFVSILALGLVGFVIASKLLVRY